jgi:hypothetical protein
VFHPWLNDIEHESLRSEITVNVPAHFCKKLNEWETAGNFGTRTY